MKRFILSLLFFLLPVFFSSNTFAQAAPTNLFLGQDNYYSVTFRGNGEAVVTLKAIFSNTGDKELSSLDLILAKVKPQDLIVYQVIRGPQCIRFGSEPLTVSPPRLKRDKEINPIPIPTPTCLEYQEADYFQYWGQAKYQKAEVTVKGEKITVELPIPIQPNKAGSFILYYRASGYAKKNIFGKYNFVFETLKINDKIRTLQVGVNVDSDLYLLGGRSQVNYQTNQTATALKTLGQANAPAQSSAFDNLYQQIGQGSIIKNASDLQPLESYTVKGSFADSQWKLYGKQIFIGLIIAILIILALISLLRMFLKKTPPSPKAKQTSVEKNLILTVFVSLVTSLLILGYTLGVMLLLRMLNNFNYYSMFNSLIVIFLILISIGVYIILFTVPTILIAIKNGWLWGIGTFVSTVLWLTLYLIIIVVIFLLVGINGFQGPPVLVPFMKGVGPSL